MQVLRIAIDLVKLLVTSSVLLVGRKNLDLSRPRLLLYVREEVIHRDEYKRVMYYGLVAPVASDENPDQRSPAIENCGTRVPRTRCY